VKTLARRLREGWGASIPFVTKFPFERWRFECADKIAEVRRKNTRCGIENILKLKKDSRRLEAGVTNGAMPDGGGDFFAFIF